MLEQVDGMLSSSVMGLDLGKLGSQGMFSNQAVHGLGIFEPSHCSHLSYIIRSVGKAASCWVWRLKSDVREV